jgi:hypothetical protein
MPTPLLLTHLTQPTTSATTRPIKIAWRRRERADWWVLYHHACRENETPLIPHPSKELNVLWTLYLTPLLQIRESSRARTLITLFIALAIFAWSSGLMTGRWKRFMVGETSQQASFVRTLRA